MSIALSLIGLSISAAWICACVAALFTTGADIALYDSPLNALGIVPTALVLLLLGSASFALTLASSLKGLQGSACADAAPANQQETEAAAPACPPCPKQANGRVVPT